VDGPRLLREPCAYTNRKFKSTAHQPNHQAELKHLTVRTCVLNGLTLWVGVQKFRAYYHFIKRQAKHKEAFDVHPIRAVLIETTDETRARKLMDLAQHPVVICAGKRATLFWFAITPLLTAPINTTEENKPRVIWFGRS